MSQVFRAWDSSLDREVAVKLLHPHLASKEESRRRLAREARAVAKLRHPNILEIYDFSGEGAQKAYLVTEFIRGVTLKRFAEEVGFGSPTLGALCGWSLAAAVEHAHGLGIIHRDIKPENVMVRDDGTLKLMDFGIARIVEQGERMTMTGTLVGSPAHMAPEIIEGREADVRSDVFSLGTLLYWLCTGKLPFEAPTTTAVLKRILDGTYPDARAVCPAVSDSLWACLREALERDPAKRLPSALALRERLEAVLREDGVDRPAEELSRFFADPAGCRATFQRALHGRLVARAQAAATLGQGARAISLVNRILAIDPASTEAAGILRTVAGRQRRRRLAQLGTALFALLGIAAGTGIAVRRAREARSKAAAASVLRPAPLASPKAAATIPAPPSERPRAPIGGAAAAHPGDDAAQPAPVRLAPLRRVVRSGAAKDRRLERGDGSPTTEGARATASPGQLRIFVQPYADVYVDGTKRATAVPTLELSLPQGPHDIRLVHPDCEDWKRTVAVGPIPGDAPLRVKLSPKPAWLKIAATPDDAEVMVDGVFRGTARQAQTDPIRVSMQDQATRKVVVRLFKPGYRDFVRDVALRANGSAELRATLEAGAR